MKTLLSIAVGSLLIVTGCDRNEPRRVGAAPEEERMTQAQQHERDQYVKTMETKLDEFDKKLDALETRGSKMSGATKKDFDNEVQRLRDERKAVATKLDRLDNATADSWTRMKADVDSSVGKLERSYEDLSRKYELTHSATPKS